MQRYFLEENNWLDGKVIITDDNVHHIKNVMRMKITDKIICVDPNGNIAKCEIEAISEVNIHANVLEWLEEKNELPVSVTIMQGLPKKNKLEFILQKGTELGCNQFVLYQGDRSIVHWDKKKSDTKIIRYKKIIKEASEQSHRHQVPNVIYEPSLEVFLTKQKEMFDVIIFAYEEEAKHKEYNSLSYILKQMRPGQHLCICIGPEGGFSKEEVEILKSYDVTPVRLGPRILRTETASLYALASVSYQFEELGI